MDESLLLAVEVAKILERLGIAYFIGGSLASSQHGVPRATLDADLVARLTPQHIAPLITALGDAWYADENAIREAVSIPSSFNLIHLGTAQKVDVFVAKNRAFDQCQFAAAVRLSLGDDGESHAPFFATAEHSVLAKLEWYQNGGDILGIIQVQGLALDRLTMIQDAGSLGVGELLLRAFNEADAALCG